MQTITNQKDFIDWITITSADSEYISRIHYRTGNDSLEITDAVLQLLNLHDKNFETTIFENCQFIECDFHHTIISNCLFKNCTFDFCEISWSKFLETEFSECYFQSCTIQNLEFADFEASNVRFINCAEILDLFISSSVKREFTFINSYLAFLKISTDDAAPLFGKNNNDSFRFISCWINKSNFEGIEFAKSKFEGCTLSLNKFIGCVLSEMLYVDNTTPSNEFNYIDLQTIINSPRLSLNILRPLFGINNTDIKDYVIELTSEIKFQSIFISYSFKDKHFAQFLNDQLMRKGITTFLWEKDAPGGKQLKEIMKSGIIQKDRILFIASKNSLKSPACQYELTEGRKKQEETWEDVLFPIHIDDYLFDVTKDKIRPIDLQDEYWKNINELKSLNSVDFSNFANPEARNNTEFEQQLFKLIQGLRK